MGEFLQNVFLLRCWKLDIKKPNLSAIIIIIQFAFCSPGLTTYWERRSSCWSWWRLESSRTWPTGSAVQDADGPHSASRWMDAALCSPSTCFHQRAAAVTQYCGPCWATVCFGHWHIASKRPLYLAWSTGWSVYIYMVFGALAQRGTSSVMGIKPENGPELLQAAGRGRGRGWRV